MIALFAAIPESVQVFLREWVWWTLLNGFSVPLALPAVLVFLILLLFFRFGIHLGLPRLFWHPHPGPQFMVGIGIGAVLWQTFFAGYVFEEFATNFTVDRPPFCEVRPDPDAAKPYAKDAGIEHSEFPGRFRFEPADVVSVWMYAGVVAGAALALALAVVVIVRIAQAIVQFLWWQIGGWKPFQKPEPEPSVGYAVWLPLGALAGWLVMTGITAGLFALPRDAVAEPLGGGLLRVAGWGKAAERRAEIERHVSERKGDTKPDRVPGSSASPTQEDATKWFSPYFPVYAAFVINFAVIAVGSIIIIALPAQLRIFSPAVGIVLILNILVFGGILLMVFPPLAVSGNFILLVLLTLVIVAGRAYKYRFPNMPSRRAPIHLENRYQELIAAEPTGGVPPDAETVRPIVSETIRYPHPQAWSGPKPPLAIVSVSGGGARAAAWAMHVLTELEQRFQRPGKGRPPVLLPYHTRLMVGASGGMIAGAYYAASLAAPGGAGVNRNEVERPNGQKSQLSIADLLEGVRRDLLTPVTHTLVNHDLPRLFVPMRFKYDRGQALEDALRDACREQLHVPFVDLREGEAQGWRPSLIFAPMLVEDGRQLFISNLDLQQVTENRAFVLGEDERLDPEGFGLLSREGVEFFKLFPGTTDFTVATAARMSASFPYVLPGVMLPTNPPRRVVDAGYFDNFGIGIAASWLFNHIEWVKENTSGVVVIQVRDGVSEAERKRETVPDSFPSLQARGLHWLTTPPAGLWNSRTAANAFQNDFLLHLLEDFFLANGLPRGYFSTVAFELDENVALNFTLTPDEIKDIAAATESDQFNLRANALLNWWHARLAEPGGSLSLQKITRE